jgi:hypothetical protein
MQPQIVSEEADPAPRVGDIVQSAIEWLRVELDDPAIVDSDNFLDIGGHSLAFSKLNKFLAENFQVVLDMGMAYEYSIRRAVTDAAPVSE